MKKMLVAAIAALTALSAFAGEKKHNDTPLAINKFYDNIFVGAGAGVNTILDNGRIGKAGLGLDVYAGKWFVPSSAVRVGWHGLSNQAVDTSNGWFAGEDSFSYNFLHIDWMWDVLNQFSYKESRIVSPRLMALAGCIFTSHNGIANQEFGFGFGAQVAVKLGKRLEGIIEANAILAREEAYRNAGKLICFPSLTAGVAVKLGKTGFNKIKPTEVEVIKTVPADCDHQKRIDSLLAQIDSLNNLPKEINVEKVTRPAIIYFDLDRHEITRREKAHIEFLAAHLPDGAKLVVTGHADKETGNPRYNLRLSERRAKAVAAYLQECGFPAERISIDAKGDTQNDYSTVAEGTTTNRCCFIQVILN